MQVICDTSFLMVLVSKPIKRVAKIESQFGKLDFFVPDIVEEELERLAQKAGPKRSLLAKTALELARTRFNRISISRARHVDDSIVDYAITRKCAVATIDTNLRRRLITNQVLVFSLSNDNLIVANPKISFKDHL
ncbi:MAG TPA: hypothetical protein VJ695_01970 [Nitrososphaera sp.]|nr:hypothetical protein [Nitrososphaera sp.]